MLDALLRSKFYSKCKSEIKLTRRRIEIIKRKRDAMQKFLRNDVADLLKKGLDSNAYGRVEQLYVDQNISSCYEFVDQSCLLILTHLSAMDKQRECPEECKEAISTLMFAAARFADLPDLRELRSLFAERYGNLLEPYANKEFVKNLRAENPTEDIKHLMLLDIKLEYDIEWDNNKAFEQKLYKPPPFVQDSSQYANEKKAESHKSQHQLGQGKVFQETENKETEVAKVVNTWGEVERKNEKQKKETTGNSSRTEVEKKQDVKHGSPYWSSSSSRSSYSSQDDSSSSSASEDGIERRKIYTTPPVYLKPDPNPQTASNSLRSVGPPYTKPDSTNSSAISPKPVPRSMRIRRPFKPVSGSQGHNEVSNQTPTIPTVSDRGYDEEENRRGRKPPKLPCDSRQVPAAPTRITSLPAESTSPAAADESKKGLARAVTDVSRGHHVHPKLPEYDDFVARLAAFRATNS
ncbi:hypothetical protein LXL04_008485 [Taraxacum kok-saghyz]